MGTAMCDRRMQLRQGLLYLALDKYRPLYLLVQTGISSSSIFIVAAEELASAVLLYAIVFRGLLIWASDSVPLAPRLIVSGGRNRLCGTAVAFSARRMVTTPLFPL